MNKRKFLITCNPRKKIHLNCFPNHLSTSMIGKESSAMLLTNMQLLKSFGVNSTMTDGPFGRCTILNTRVIKYLFR
jgi:hypothetical protein